jgi:hypothetical protein
MECCVALDLIFLHGAALDLWRWLSDPNANYSVSGTYHLLTHIVSLAETVHNDIIYMEQNCYAKGVSFCLKVIK